MYLKSNQINEICIVLTSTPPPPQIGHLGFSGLSNSCVPGPAKSRAIDCPLKSPVFLAPFAVEFPVCCVLS